MSTTSRCSLLLLSFLSLILPARGQEAPQFSPGGGSSATVFYVQITCSTPGASIHYTTNGVDPLLSDPVVEGPVAITRTVTLKARAWVGETPGRVTSETYQVTGAVAAGNGHTLALKFDSSRVWAWGLNTNGQLGNGNLTSQSLPVVVLAGTNRFSNVWGIAAGDVHSAYLKGDGTVWVSGGNANGQLGNNTVTDSKYPVQVTGFASGTAVSHLVTGANHLLAIDAGGGLWAWGRNANGQLGIGNLTTPQKTAVRVKISGTLPFTGVTAAAGGDNHSLAIAGTNQSVYAWGYNASNQLGNGSNTQTSYPVEVITSGSVKLTNAVDLAAGANFSMALQADGSLWSWGINTNGQLGNGTVATQKTAGRVLETGSLGASPVALKNIVAIAAGDSHALALTADGTVLAWGLNSSGQLGNGNTTQQLRPVTVLSSSNPTAVSVPLTNVVAIAAGHTHSVALTADGTIYTWGLASSGQLGNGAVTSANFKVATPYGTLPRVTKQPPCVSLLVAPAAGPYIAPLDLTVTATASDPDGTLARVELFSGSSVLEPLGSSSPFALTLKELSAGIYPLSAVAIDSDGGWTRTPVQNVTVIPPTVSVAAVSGTVAEPLYGRADSQGVFRFSRTYTGSIPDVSLEIFYSVSGAAKSGTDYLELSGCATIPAGAAFVDLAVTPLADMLVEGSESVVVSVLPQATYTASATSATVVVTDTPPVVSVSKIADAGYSGGNPVDGKFRFTRTGPLDPLTAEYTVDTPASAGTDYLAVSGTVTFPDGIDWVDVVITPISGLKSSKALAVNVVPLPSYLIGGGSGRATMQLQMPTGKITGGGEHTVAMRADGTVFSCGSQAEGRLGNGVNAAGNLTTWQSVCKMWDSGRFNDAMAVAAGANHTLAVDRAGFVYSCGANRYGQLGNQTTTPNEIPRTVYTNIPNRWLLDGVVAVAAGHSFSLALNGTGEREVWSWGLNNDGRTGNGLTGGNSIVAGKVFIGTSGSTHLTGISAIAAGDNFGLAQTGDGNVWSWGNNAYGQLGDGTNTPHPRAMPVKMRDGSLLSEVVAVAAGRMHSVALRQSAREPGTVWCWGSQGSGRLGNKLTAGYSTYPVPVLTASGTLSGIVQIAAGPEHTLALDKEGRIWAWGVNNDGQLGCSNTLASPYAIPVVSCFDKERLPQFFFGDILWYAQAMPPITSIGAGGYYNGSGVISFSLAIARDGRILSWGHNAKGELGITGNLARQVTPFTTSENPILSNQDPFATAVSAVCVANSCATIPLPGRDPNGSRLIFSTGTALHGNVSISGSNAKYTPNPGWSGTDCFPFTLSNGKGSTSNTVTVFVIPEPAVTVVPITSGTFCVYHLSSSVAVNGPQGSVSSYSWAVLGGSDHLRFTAPTARDTDVLVGAPGIYQIRLSIAYSSGITVSKEITINTIPENLAQDGSNCYRRDPNGTSSPLSPYLIALDSQKGVALTGTGEMPERFPVAPWFMKIRRNPAYMVSTGSGNRLGYEEQDRFVNPIAAFGSLGGGAPLYINQNYRFGVGFGEFLAQTTLSDIRINVYDRAAFATGTGPVESGTAMTFTLPRPDQPTWKSFQENGYVLDLHTESLGISTTVQCVPDPVTGSALLVVSHSGARTDKCYKVEFMGTVTNGTDSFPIASDRVQAPAQSPVEAGVGASGYTLNFDQRQAWNSTFIDQPHFTGCPLPAEYQGKTLEELLRLQQGELDPIQADFEIPSATGTLVALGGSPELRRHPVLDQFAREMAYDPIAITNYILNEIELTDAVVYKNMGLFAASSINAAGVNRGALATFLEAQGSPAEQCALLIYLLRQCTDPATGQKIPCGYVFPNPDETKLLDVQMSRVLRMQLASSGTGSPRLLSVNYPWVAAYINGSWVHLFPWLKDTVVTEGLDFYNYMPDGCKSAAQWVRGYLLSDPSMRMKDSTDPQVRRLAAENDNPGVLFPLYVKNALKRNHPEISMEDLGVVAYNRRNYFSDWAQFPRPWQTGQLGSSNLVDSLGNVAEIFDTVQFTVTNQAGQTLIDTGTFNSMDIHNHRVLVYANHPSPLSASEPTKITYLDGKTAVNTLLRLSVEAYSPGAARISESPLLSSTDASFCLNITHNRHSLYVRNGSSRSSAITASRPFSRDDMVACCYDFGRVTAGMVDVQAKQYWAAQQMRNPQGLVDLEVSQGIPAYLSGMSYYKKLSDFKETLGALTKYNATSFVASGLSVLAGKPLLSAPNFTLPSTRYPILSKGDVLKMTVPGSVSGLSLSGSSSSTSVSVRYEGNTPVDLSGITSIILYPDPDNSRLIASMELDLGADRRGAGTRLPCSLVAGGGFSWSEVSQPAANELTRGKFVRFMQSWKVQYLGSTRPFALNDYDWHHGSFYLVSAAPSDPFSHLVTYTALQFIPSPPLVSGSFTEPCSVASGIHNNFATASRLNVALDSNPVSERGVVACLNLPVMTPVVDAIFESDLRVLPRVDMHFQDLSVAGNSSLHPDSAGTSGFWNWAPLFTAEASAQEHRVINHFYQNSDAISTVKLLDLALDKKNAGTGPGLVFLSGTSDLALEGEKPYTFKTQTKKLREWDAPMWTSVVDALSKDPRANCSVIMTPGPVSSVPRSGSSAYSGMGAFIVEADSVAALISGNMNGGSCGSYLADPFYRPTVESFSSKLLTADYGEVTLLAFGGTSPITLAPQSLSLSNFGSQYEAIQSGDMVLSAGANTAYNQQSFLTGYGNTSCDRVRNVFNLGNLGETCDNRSLLGSIGKGIMDPVNSVTGEFYIDSVDLKLNGPMPLEIRRNYGSQNLADNNFGHGWKMSYFPYLVVSSTASAKQIIYAAEMDGSVIAYTKQASPANCWVPVAADNPALANLANDTAGSLGNVFNNRLELSGSTYTLTGADGSVRTFLVRSFPTPGSNGLMRQRPYLSQWKDNRGNSHKFSFGEDPGQVDWGQLVRIESNNGNFAGFSYNATGHIVAVFSGDGRRLSYDYDDEGDLVKVTLPDGSSIGYDYRHTNQTSGRATGWYSEHLMIRERKPEGRLLENDYDDQRRVTEQRATVGPDKLAHRNATFTYVNTRSRADNTITGYTLLTDVNNNETRYDYSMGQITQTTDPLGQRTQEAWFQTDDAASGAYRRSLARQVDKRGLTTSFFYDSRGNLLKRTMVGNLTGSGTDTAVWTYLYNDRNLVTSCTDPEGIVTSYAYGTQPGRYYLPVSVSKFAASKEIITTGSMEYEDLSEGTASSCGLLHRTTEAVGTPDQVVTTLTNNAHGFTVSKSTGANSVTPTATIFYRYNLRGEVTVETDPAGRRTSYAYDNRGNRVWQERRETTGRVVDWRCDYFNQNGEIDWSQGSRYNPVDYIYRRHDGAGHLSEEIKWRTEAAPDGSGVQAVQGEDAQASTFYLYDPFGNLTEIRDARHNSTTMQYDAIGQMTGRQVHQGDASAAVVSSESFPRHEAGGEVSVSINPLGGKTTRKFTSRGQVYEQTNPDGTVQKWSYDLSGRVSRELLPNGATRITGYDPLNRTVTTQLQAGGSSITQVTSYDRRGNVISKTDGESNTVTSTFDPLNRVLTTTAADRTGASPTQTVTHLYDDAGSSHTVTNSLGESTVTTTDALGRPVKVLVTGSKGEPVRFTGYSYSDDHQSSTQTSGSNAAVTLKTTTFTDSFGQIVLVKTGTTFSSTRYDPAGNAVATRNERGLFATSRYDCLNRLVARQTASASGADGALTTFVYLNGGRELERHMPGGALPTNRSILPDEKSANSSEPRIRGRSRGISITLIIQGQQSRRGRPPARSGRSRIRAESPPRLPTTRSVGWRAPPQREASHRKTR